MGFLLFSGKTNKIDKDKKILKQFISIYCKQKHINNGYKEYEDGLCENCYELLKYAEQKLTNCSLNPKPPCKNCKIHCYNKAKRTSIKEVMRFSGFYAIKHGKINLIFHYFF